MAKLPNAEKLEYTTITVDVFDTVLLRNRWPEELQFLETAGLWAPEVNKVMRCDVDGYELYTYRRDIRRVLHAAKKQKFTNEYKDEGLDHAILGIEEWFGHIIDAVSDHYCYKLQRSDKAALLQKLIEIEVATEKASLSVNHKLIAWLRNVKLVHPELRVYYLSDMYLRAADIMELFEHFGIVDIFDGGATSGDLKRGKWSGKLYAHFQKDKISIGTNLHVGDNYHSDVAMASLFGSEAVYYNTYRNKFYRRLKTWQGFSKIRRIETRKRKLISQQYMSYFLNDATYRKVSSTSRYMASLFAPPMAAYLTEMMWFSTFGDMKMIAVSSEAKTFKKFSKILSPQLDDSTKITYFPGVNRKQAMLALVGSIFEGSKDATGKATIAQILRHEQGMMTQADIYNFIFDNKPDQSMPDIVLNKLSDIELGRLIKNSMDMHGSEKIKAARIEIDAMVDPLLGASQIFIMDVGWNGTVQAMLQQYLLSQKSAMRISGIYMGFRKNSRRKLMIRGEAQGWLMEHIGAKPDSDFFVPDIWEFVYTNKDYGTGLQDLIQRGLEQGIQYFKEHVHVSPMEFYLATNKDLRRLFTRPHIQEVKLFGMLNFDSGFVDVKNARLVDMTSTRLKVLRSLLLSPRKFTEYVAKPYCWTAGYLRFYRITPLAKLIIKLSGSDKKVT